MRAPRSAGLLLALGLAGLASASVAGQEGPPEEPLARVIIYSPPPGKPALGDIDFRAQVLSAYEVKEVRLRIDGREVARFLEPPYELPVKLGDENVAHRFEVVVLGYGLELARVERLTPPIRVDEEVNLGLRQLYVTVTRGESRVRHLGREVFRVFDDGREQTLVTFEGGDAALTAAILVDASTSMIGRRLAAAVEGARAFMGGLRDLDESKLILFSDRLLYESSYDADPEALEGQLEELQAAGGTALNDHLFLALKRLENRQGRRVVVLLSDGLDVDSVLQMRDVLWMARRSRSLIYWIQLLDEGAADRAVVTPWRTVEEHRREVEDLYAAVKETGGRTVPILDAGEAEEAFREILRELREQYVLGYYPDQEYDDGRWRQVDVRVDRRGVQVRTRGGYLDY